jgi:mono/diheme cytochrome c family protein
VFPPFSASYLGAGTVIGTNAIVHLVMAQGIALGLISMLALFDWYALRHGGDFPDEWAKLLMRLLTFGSIVTTVAGAVTGAGIWFTIGSLAPRATASMLRVFFWPWFIEWLVFVGEVVGLLILYLAWKRLERYRRLRIALLLGYGVLGFWSAFLITGIIGFMLTSGAWPEHATLAAAFFNPSFWPQLLARLSIAGVIGAVIGSAVILWPGLHAKVQRRALRLFGGILLVSLLVFAPAVAWYFAVVPDFYTTRTVFAVLTQHFSRTPSLFYAANLVAAGLLLAMAAISIARYVRGSRWLVIPSLLIAIGMVAEMERVREFIRGPYLMPSHMYASEVLMTERFANAERGMLADRYWYQRLRADGNLDQAGADLFHENCGTCHTVGGINNMRSRVRGRSEDGIRVLLDHTHELVSFMPPFSGSREEARALARFLYRLQDGHADLQSHSRVLAKGTAEWETRP